MKAPEGPQERRKVSKGSPATPRQRKAPSVLSNLETAAKSADWLGSADLGAVAAALRLARAIDQCAEAGEWAALAPLVSRLTALMVELRLTPRSREQLPTPETNPDDGIQAIQQTFLRLVQPQAGKQTSSRAKSRPSSGKSG